MLYKDELAITFILLYRLTGVIYSIAMLAFISLVRIKQFSVFCYLIKKSVCFIGFLKNII